MAGFTGFTRQIIEAPAPKLYAKVRIALPDTPSTPSNPVPGETKAAPLVDSAPFAQEGSLRGGGSAPDPADDGVSPVPLKKFRGGLTA